MAAVQPPSLKSDWVLNVRDLVCIGIFASLAKSSSLLVALAGGGMNPITLILKNMLYVTLFTALAVKVSKPGALTLAHFTSIFVSAVILGQSVAQIPFSLAACLLGECIMFVIGRYKNAFGVILGVFIADIAAKAGAFLLSWLAYRETPQMVIPGLIVASIGILGSIIGSFAGYRFIKELRHAGLIFR